MCFKHCLKHVLNKPCLFSANSGFESQKAVNSNIIKVKMCEQCFVQTKNYSNRRYLPVVKEGFIFI